MRRLFVACVAVAVCVGGLGARAPASAQLATLAQPAAVAQPATVGQPANPWSRDPHRLPAHGRAAAGVADRATLFPLDRGWLGGDAAYSIPLGPGRILWLFGDTFTDLDHSGLRRWRDIVGNSVGISIKTPMGWETSFHYGMSSSGDALPFFRSDNPQIRYWPRHGFYDGEEVHVFLLKALYTGVGPFGFEIVGSTLASFRPDAIGRGAPVTVDVPITYDDGVAPQGYVAGLAVARTGDQVLIYSIGASGTVFLNRYADGGFEYLASEEEADAGNVWKPGLQGTDARAVLDAGASEFSVEYHPASRNWLMVYSDYDLASGKIWLRKARQPEGPWSDPILLYSVPELTGPGRLPFSFTYAAKSHPELESDARLRVSYVVNLDEDPGDPAVYDQTDLWRILQPHYYGYYVPRLVALRVPLTND